MVNEIAPEITAGHGVVLDEDIEDAEHVRHRPRLRHDDVARGEQRPVAADRQHAPRRRVRAEAVVRRGAAPGGDRLLSHTVAGRGGNTLRLVAVVLKYWNPVCRIWK